MKYLSTRDNSLKKSFDKILYQGLSNEGGLYLPVEWPSINLLNLENNYSKNKFLVDLNIFHKILCRCKEDL